MDEHHHSYMGDFRQLMAAGAPPPPGIFPSHLHRSQPPVDVMMMAAGNPAMKLQGRHTSGCGLHDFPADSSAGDGASARWPRQETLTLLEIRSRLDSRFREANQKGPLWDEVSRIMSEEHGYQRSGKKCREKFENLYKYYKKTKEGKAGRQDGKHYRFFRQLEALYGDHTSNNAPTAACLLPQAHALVNSLDPYHPSIISPQFASNAGNNSNHETTTSRDRSMKVSSDSLILSGSSDFDTSSSNDNDDACNRDPTVENVSRAKKRRSGRSWKAKIKEFIDSRMRKLMEKQEEWVEKMVRAMEEKDQERFIREEEWKRQEMDRIDKEHKFWAKERAWIEARDAALMDALQNLTSRRSSPVPSDHMMDHRTDQIHERDVGNSMKRSKENNNLSRCSNYNNYFRGDHINGSSMYDNRGVGYCGVSEGRVPEAVRVHQLSDGFGLSNSNPVVQESSCFRFVMGDGESSWENYGVKLNKGGDN